MSRRDAVSALDRALIEWTEGGSDDSAASWLRRELDESGGPRRLSLQDWLLCARMAATARRRRDDWSAEVDEGVVGLIDAASRFERPMGVILGRPSANGVVRSEPLQTPAAKSARPAAGRRGGWASATQVLACLGDVRSGAVAVDHRGAGSCRIELVASGRSWLGPEWTVGAAEPSRSVLKTWATEDGSELLEWRAAGSGSSTTHTMAVFHGLGLALIAAFVESTVAVPMVAARIAIPDGVEASALAGSRAIQLDAPGPKPAHVQILPIGLPRGDYLTERGRFVAEARGLVLEHAGPRKKTWLPLLVSWDPRRRGKPVDWRSLTITEKGKVAPPERASAARITWGRGETYLLYRSHAKPALRAVLGHCTTTRFLFARFDKEGNVTPILKLED